MTKKTDEALNTSAVTLPAGSYDFQKLDEGLTNATKASDDDRDAAVETALRDAILSPDALDGSDPSSQPGFSVVETPSPIVEGETESLRVFDPAKADESQQADQAADKDRAAMVASETASK